MCFPSAAGPAGSHPNWERDFGPARPGSVGTPEGSEVGQSGEETGR